jgi:UDP-N-acetylmuramoyl-tripeptide--D-alanyl-D-alanine ligase
MKSMLKKIVVAVVTWEAKQVLRKYTPKVVAVTGSVGKTSTKDAVYTLLASVAYARKSEKSFNSELGVPLTILGLPTAWSSVRGWIENSIEGLHLILTNQSYPEWLVLEVGADRPGDIQALAWLAPQVVVFTRFPDVPVHVEYFPSPEALIEEKRSLKRALRPGGTLIVNQDDPLMRAEQVLEGQHVVSYGFSEGSTVRADGYLVQYEGQRPIGITCMVHFQNEHLPLMVPGTLGTSHLYALLAALALAVAEGVRFDRAVAAMGVHMPPAGRMRLLPGMSGTTLIDDTYNASPIAVESGLATLQGIVVPGKKVVVLGDMMELGDFSVEAHRAVGEQVAKVAQVFVAVGIRMMGAAEAARATQGVCTRIETVKDADEARALLTTIIAPGDVVYLKGSQSVRMERVVETLLNDPASAVNVLVRQDGEWKNK